MWWLSFCLPAFILSLRTPLLGEHKVEINNPQCSSRTLPLLSRHFPKEVAKILVGYVGEESEFHPVSDLVALGRDSFWFYDRETHSLVFMEKNSRLGPKLRVRIDFVPSALYVNASGTTLYVYDSRSFYSSLTHAELQTFLIHHDLSERRRFVGYLNRPTCLPLIHTLMVLSPLPAIILPFAISRSDGVIVGVVGSVLLLCFLYLFSMFMSFQVPYDLFQVSRDTTPVVDQVANPSAQLAQRDGFQTFGPFSRIIKTIYCGKGLACRYKVRRSCGGVFLLNDGVRVMRLSEDTKLLTSMDGRTSALLERNSEGRHFLLFLE